MQTQLFQDRFGVMLYDDAKKILELRWFAETTLHDGGVAGREWAGTAPAGEAAAFAGAGLPFLAARAAPAAAAGGLDPAGLAWETSLHALLLARLCAYPLLPLDVVATARAVEDRLRAILEQAGDLPELAPLRARGATFRARAERLHLAALHVLQADATGYEEGLERVNRALLALNRTLVPLLHHAGDRYAAAPAMPDLLPGLDAALALASAAAAGEGAGEPAHRLRVAMVRERNRLGDALHDATAAIDDALAALLALGIN